MSQTIGDVNRTLRGWFEYFKHSHRKTFRTEDGFVRRRLRSILRRQTHRKVPEGTAPTRHAGALPILMRLGFSTCNTPISQHVSPLTRMSGSEGGSGIDERVNFRCQTATRSADSLVAVCF
jgi:Group II intron, maturase-specific domain